MRGWGSTGLAALALAGCSARPVPLPDPRPADWRSFDVPECGARVDLPGAPTHQSDHWTGDDAYHRSDVYEASLGSAYGFAVSCLREPGDGLRRKTPDALVAEMANRRSTPSLTVLDHRDVSSGHCRGREERSRIDTRRGPIEVTARVYVVGDHGYVVLATTPDTPLGHAHAIRFLDSFHADRCDAP